jgi:hypothetical protein
MESATAAVRRMQLLKRIADSSLPDWIDVPEQYGVYKGPRMSIQYQAMEQIDSGITITMLYRYGLECFQQQNAVISREFGELAKDEVDEVMESYEESRDLLNKAVRQLGQLPCEVMIDYGCGNVIVERLAEPIDGKRHKLWIIDQ